MGGEAGTNKAKAAANGDVTSHPALPAKPAIHIIVLVRPWSPAVLPFSPGTLLRSRASAPNLFRSPPLPAPHPQRDCTSPSLPPRRVGSSIPTRRLLCCLFFWWFFRGQTNNSPPVVVFFDRTVTSQVGPRVSTLVGRGLGPDLSFRSRTRHETKSALSLFFRLSFFSCMSERHGVSGSPVGGDGRCRLTLSDGPPTW